MLNVYTWLKVQLNALRSEEKGVTIVEYVIMVGLVALAVALAAPNIASTITGVFDDVASAIAALY